MAFCHNILSMKNIQQSKMVYIISVSVYYDCFLGYLPYIDQRPDLHAVELRASRKKV